MANQRTSTNKALGLFELAIVFPTLAALGYLVWQNPGDIKRELAIWALVVAGVELIPVPLWRSTSISMGFPLLLAIAFQDKYTAVAAGVTAFVAAFDPREFRRELGLLRALFNRCQIALAVVAASLVFHEIASIESSTPRLLAAAMAAAVADYILNTTLVGIAAGLYYRIPPFQAIRALKVGNPSEFFVSYIGLGLAGLILAKVWLDLELRWLALPMIVLPLLLARQMFFRSKALEEAHKELQDREQVLRALSNRMAEERQDERETIAAYLHDDLAQLLFKLSIQVDIARRHLAAGKLPETEKTLDDIRETKTKTADRIRALIRDLHRSPLGRAGLAEALEGFIDETARESDVRFHTDIDEIPLPPPIALLVYHIAREGVMNALKHADASNVWVTVKQQGDIVVLTLRDDGAGFDVEAPPPEGHFGLTMMRERALVGGGTYELKSEPGEGTTITVRFPTSWLQQQEPPPGGAATGDGGGPGTARSPEGDPAPQSVLA